jgi:hypothetical protein
LEDQGVDGRMGSEWILRRLAKGCEVGSTGSGYGPVASCCECGDEPLGSCATELRMLSTVASLICRLLKIVTLCYTSYITETGGHYYYVPVSIWAILQLL